MMIKIDAIVREEKFEDVKQALQDIEVNGITVSQVMGCGAQRGYTEIVRGFETGKNLEGRNENPQENSGHRSSHQLTLEEINAIIGDDEASEEDVLAAEMLRATGGNVDYMI